MKKTIFNEGGRSLVIDPQLRKFWGTGKAGEGIEASDPVMVNLDGVKVVANMTIGAGVLRVEGVYARPRFISFEGVIYELGGLLASLEYEHKEAAPTPEDWAGLQARTHALVDRALGF